MHSSGTLRSIMAPKAFLAALSPRLFTGEKGEGKSKEAALGLQGPRQSAHVRPLLSHIVAEATHSRSPRG
eukprot:3168853-Amphidinium_carterae.1